MLKKFLIVASMICVLVSSLVVVSFADEVDESNKYNYDRFVGFYFSNLETSTPQSVYVEFSMDAEALCIFRVEDRVIASYEFDRVIVESSKLEDTYKTVDYTFYTGTETNYQLTFVYSLEDGFTFYRFRDVIGDDLINSTVDLHLDIYYTGVMTYSNIVSDNLVVSTGVVENPSSPSYLLSLLFTGFGSAIGGLALGVKESLFNVIWVDPTATNKVLSPLVTFIFTIAGLSIAMTVFFLIFRLIRFGRQR